MKTFYSKLIIVIALLMSYPVYATPSLNMVAGPDPVPFASTVQFDLSFSEPVGGASPNQFFGLILEVTFDANYLAPRYGLGSWNACTGVNCGTTTTSLDTADFEFYKDSFGYLVFDVYPSTLSSNAITDIGFITFDVIKDEINDISTRIEVSGDYDGNGATLVPVRGEGIVTITGSQNIPEPGLLSLLLLGLAGMRVTALKRKYVR